MKQVLKAPNTSMLIADLIKSCPHKNAGHVEHHLVSFYDSEIHAEQNGNLENDMKF